MNVSRISAEAGASGTQSIERAIALLLLVGRAGPAGARLSDLVLHASLPKPTVRRVLLALVRNGLLDQDAGSRRYHIGPEAYILGTLASARFGIHALSMDGLARLARDSGDCAFLSVPRDTFAVCLHREEGRFPIRTHVLQAGDRHPLGIGGGSLALLAARPDAEVERVLSLNGEVMARTYPMFSPELLRESVAETRQRGYALNPGVLFPGSWGIGVALLGADGRPVGALSIAAIESRLTPDRQQVLAPQLQREARLLEAALSRTSGEAAPPPARTGRPAARAAQKVRS
ncbi:MAG: transcriptional regulator [Rhizobiales bacterium 32-66-8]|nr:MAG: transcriptional regulator [Rhizobiales bacterium 32-66-8]